MTFYKSNGDRVPDHIMEAAEQAKAGKIDRREFLALASVFGASTAMAYGMIGLAAPTQALAQEPKKGGVIRVSMFVKEPEGSAHLRLVGNGQCRRASSWSRWSSTRANSHSSRPCSKAGKSTTTPPNTRCMFARA